MSNAESARKALLIAYICYGIGIVFPVLAIVGVIINYINQDQTQDQWVGSHHRWLKRTFWIGLLLTLVLSALSFIPVLGFVTLPVIFAIGIWYIYRIVRGGLRFLDNQPMYG